MSLQIDWDILYFVCESLSLSSCLECNQSIVCPERPESEFYIHQIFHSNWTERELARDTQIWSNSQEKEILAKLGRRFS